MGLSSVSGDTDSTIYPGGYPVELVAADTAGGDGEGDTAFVGDGVPVASAEEVADEGPGAGSV